MSKYKFYIHCLDTEAYLKTFCMQEPKCLGLKTVQLEEIPSYRCERNNNGFWFCGR